MLRVRKTLCLGCGVCADSCARGAISLLSGQAHIEQERCNACGLCIDACPRGAIVEAVPVSRESLVATVAGLRQQADDLLERIERLRGTERVTGGVSSYRSGGYRAAQPHRRLRRRGAAPTASSTGRSAPLRQRSPSYPHRYTRRAYR